MKSLNVIPVGLFMLLASAGMNAQQAEADNTVDKSISFGVKGGATISTLVSNDDDFKSPNARTSFFAGVTAEFPISDKFSIQPEVLYSQQGAEIRNDGFLGDDRIEYQLDYINVPVLAKIYLFEGLSIDVGPQFSFKVNEEIDSNVTGNSGDIDMNEVEDFDFGVAAGLTFQTKSGIFATGRYTRGFTDVIKDVDLQNSVFQLGLGYKF